MIEDLRKVSNHKGFDICIADNKALWVVDPDWPEHYTYGGQTIPHARAVIDALPTDPHNHILYAKKLIQDIPCFGNANLWWVSWNHDYSHQTYSQAKEAYRAILYHRVAHPEDPIRGFDPQGNEIPQEKLERFAYMVMFPHSFAYQELRQELEWDGE